MMTKEKIDELYTRAFHGDVRARETLIHCAGRDATLDESVFSHLSCLSGKDVRAVIKKFAKQGNVSAICSYGTNLVTDGMSSKSLTQGLCWLEEAGNKGLSRAWGFLSSIHWYGDYGVGKNSMLAMKYCVKAYFAGAKEAAHGMADMLYKHLEISDVMLGDAVNWCKISLELNPNGNASWYLRSMTQRYGEDRLTNARKIIPEDFAGRPMEFYISQYGHPRFGLLDSLFD